ncbi:MAG: PIN domain-containing protein [Desulfurococcaceae archaeon]
MGHSGARSNKGCLKLLLDTNFVVLLAERPQLLEDLEKDLATCIEPVVLSKVMDELEAVLRSLPSKRQRKVRAGLGALLRRCTIVRVDADSPEVDELILREAKILGCAVATNDKELRRKLRASGIPEVYLREESGRLEYSGFVP